MNDKDFLSENIIKQSDIKIKENLLLLKKELFNLRFQLKLGELSNISRFSKVRKNIARINTEISRRLRSKQDA